MGLTIHYRLKYDEREPKKILERLRQRAMDLPFAEVSPKVYHFKGRLADWQNHGRDSIFTWALIQATENVEHEEYGRKYYIEVLPKEVYLFNAWPGEECEEANFGLAKYPATVDFHGKRLRTNLGDSWRWNSFCKTQYASKVSLEHFLRCHYAVCLLLKEAEKLGLLARVNDEGNFWDSWDFEALAREVSGWNHMIQDAVDRLKATFGDKNVLSPIDG